MNTDEQELQGPITVGDRLLWEPGNPLAREEIIVTGVTEAFGEVRIQTMNLAGRRYWNDESRTREACIRDISGLVGDGWAAYLPLELR